jgi:hypothetical protein
VLVVVHIIAVPDHFPHTDLSRQPRFRHAVNKTVGLEAVRDELSNRDECESVFLSELLELRPARSGAVIVQNLANDSRGIHACKPSQIHRGFSMTYALQHSALSRPERKDVARSPEIGRHRRWINRDLNGLCAILSADAGGYSEPVGSIYAHRKRGALLLGVLVALLRKPQLVRSLTSEREADESAGVSNHEVYELGRHQWRRTDKVAFVLAILIVGHQDHPACLDVRDRLLNRSKSHFCSL